MQESRTRKYCNGQSRQPAISSYVGLTLRGHPSIIRISRSRRSTLSHSSSARVTPTAGTADCCGADCAGGAASQPHSCLPARLVRYLFVDSSHTPARSVSIPVSQQMLDAATGPSLFLPSLPCPSLPTHSLSHDEPQRGRSTNEQSTSPSRACHIVPKRLVRVSCCEAINNE